MTEDEIKEGQKLILEFIGWKYDGEFWLKNLKRFPDIQIINDWSYLMKVVDKIESLKHISVYISKTYLSKKHRVEISHESPNYTHSQNNKTVFTESESKIECVFSACVEFIIWYNSNKNKIN